MHGRAGTYGCPCTGARLPVHPRTTVHVAYWWSCVQARPAVRWLCQLRLLLPGCCPIFLCFAILGARAFLEPLIFLKIVREIFFSVKT